MTLSCTSVINTNSYSLDVFLITYAVLSKPLYDIGDQKKMTTKLKSIRAGHGSAVSRILRRFDERSETEKNQYGRSTETFESQSATATYTFYTNTKSRENWPKTNSPQKFLSSQLRILQGIPLFV
ncbi:Hypothetical predicted protein [Mytilus galloprovincialis]|uniref:Uncharacterized protein n=1 Tax=Mytilus galloprovincialis TaxID=29158 RepID=A0A8B6HL16_MYTGA|nr:Hypothetical predicted protein [Mytilus galloprovincialis]